MVSYRYNPLFRVTGGKLNEDKIGKKILGSVEVIDTTIDQYIIDVAAGLYEDIIPNTSYVVRGTDATSVVEVEADGLTVKKL